MKLSNIISALTLPALLLLSINSYADNPANNEHQINSACLKQAISLANQLKTEVYTEMDSVQSNKIIKLASNSCKQQFSQVELAKAVASSGHDIVHENEPDNSIMDIILSGDTERKAGNKRLRNLKR